MFRLQNSPYFCVFKHVRAVKQKVWNEAEARAVRARKTLTPRFTDFFTDFEEKPTVLQSIKCLRYSNLSNNPVWTCINIIKVNDTACVTE